MSNVKYTTVHSNILNRTFYIEVIEDHPNNLDRASWGDVNPATKKLETGDYGKKNAAGVDEKDSIITKDNGFNNITYLKPGQSYMGYIEQLEKNHIKVQKQLDTETLSYFFVLIDYKKTEPPK